MLIISLNVRIVAHVSLFHFRDLVTLFGGGVFFAAGDFFVLKWNKFDLDLIN